MKYLYHFHKLYPVDRGTLHEIQVEEDTLICYDVQPHQPNALGRYIQGEDAKSWTFSVEGMEGRFRTNYDWALVRHDDTNGAIMQKISEAHMERADLQKQINKLWELVDTAAKDLRNDKR